MRAGVVVGQVSSLDFYGVTEVIDAALNKPMGEIRELAARAIYENHLTIAQILMVETGQLGINIELADLDVNLSIQLSQ